MLDAISLGRLRNYEVVIEKLTRTYPTEWRVVYAADELARSVRSNRFRAKVFMDTRVGKKNLSKLGFKQVLESCVHHELPRRQILAYSGPCTSLDLAVGHRGQLESTGVKAITPQGSEGDSPGLQWPAQGSTSSKLLRRDVNRPGFQDGATMSHEICCKVVLVLRLRDSVFDLQRPKDLQLVDVATLRMWSMGTQRGMRQCSHVQPSCLCLIFFSTLTTLSLIPLLSASPLIAPDKGSLAPAK